MLDLVLWVPKQRVGLYQVSLTSEMVGFKFSVILGDLTRNDPLMNEINYQCTNITLLLKTLHRENFEHFTKL